MQKDNLVLLVEDDSAHTALTIRALAKHRLVNDIVTVSDGVEALDFLFGTGAFVGRDTRIQPTLILLDIKLPRIDGLEVLRRLRSDKRTKNLPVVLLSSSDEQRDIVQAYDLGANSYVRKPIDFTEFLEATRQLGLYWLVLNQPPGGGCNPWECP